MSILKCEGADWSLGATPRDSSQKGQGEGQGSSLLSRARADADAGGQRVFLWEVLPQLGKVQPQAWILPEHWRVKQIGWGWEESIIFPSIQTEVKKVRGGLFLVNNVGFTSVILLPPQKLVQLLKKNHKRNLCYVNN